MLSAGLYISYPLQIAECRKSDYTYNCYLEINPLTSAVVGEESHFLESSELESLLKCLRPTNAIALDRLGSCCP